MKHQMPVKELAYIRSRVLSHISQSVDDFSCEDVLSVLSNDWQCIRFGKSQQTIDNTIDAIVTALKWKKSFGVNNITEDYFPREIKELFTLLRCGVDKNGGAVHYFNRRAANSPKYKELTLLMIEFGAFIANHIDKIVGRKGGVIIIDLKGTERLNPTNCNLHMARHFMEFNNYFPRLNRAYYFVDMPAFHHWISWVILSFAKPSVRRKIHFVKRRDLTLYINQEQLPVEYGGNGKLAMTLSMEGPPFRQAMKDRYSKDVIDKFYDGYSTMMRRFKDC